MSVSSIEALVRRLVPVPFIENEGDGAYVTLLRDTLRVGEALSVTVGVRLCDGVAVSVTNSLAEGVRVGTVAELLPVCDGVVVRDADGVAELLGVRLAPVREDVSVGVTDSVDDGVSDRVLDRVTEALGDFVGVREDVRDTDFVTEGDGDEDGDCEDEGVKERPEPDGDIVTEIDGDAEGVACVSVRVGDTDTLIEGESLRLGETERDVVFVGVGDPERLRLCDGDTEGVRLRLAVGEADREGE